MGRQQAVQMAAGDGAHHQQAYIVLTHETRDDFLGKTVQQVGLCSIDGVLGDQLVEGFAVLAAALGHVVFIFLRYLGVEQQRTRQRRLRVQVLGL